MTTLDPSAQLIRELIFACKETQAGFRSAAEAVTSGELKRLFVIYAQQRSRFAEELGGFLGEDVGPNHGVVGVLETLIRTDETVVLRQCLERERSALAVYQKALNAKSLPTKTRFLVSAQLAFLERVYSRIEGISPAVCTPVLTPFAQIAL